MFPLVFGTFLVVFSYQIQMATCMPFLDEASWSLTHTPSCFSLLFKARPLKVASVGCVVITELESVR